MKKITNLRDKMFARCPYPRLWDKANCDDTGYPVSELGYFRCDHDGYAWHNTVWPLHQTILTDELAAEFDAVLSAFRRSFKDIRTMSAWCGRNAGRTGSYDEYNAYYEGDFGFYWFRMITRRGDYNLYLHCYSKAAMQSQQDIV